MKEELKVVLVNPDAKLPEKTKGNLCYDLFIIEDDEFESYHDGKRWVAEYVLKPGQRRLFDTGCILRFPDGFGGNIRDRSGKAYKNGLHVMAGVIDENFRDTTKILVINLNSEPQTIFAGDKLAQIKLEEDFHFPVVQITQEELDETDRGTNSFGSSGE